MAYQRYQGYQYETSPRKLEPDYEPRKNPYDKKKTATTKAAKQGKKTQQKQQVKPKIKVVFGIAFAFAILFAISYQNSLINESFNEKESLKKNLATIQKENEQLKVNIEKSLNLNNVEQSAKELLGMKKLDNSQKVYVNLPKQDYVESNKTEVVIEDNTNWWNSLLKTIGISR